MDPSDQRRRSHMQASTPHFSHGTAAFSTRIQRPLIAAIAPPLLGHCSAIAPPSDPPSGPRSNPGRPSHRSNNPCQFSKSNSDRSVPDLDPSRFALAANGLPVRAPAPSIVLFDWVNYPQLLWRGPARHQRRFAVRFL